MLIHVVQPSTQLLTLFAAVQHVPMHQQQLPPPPQQQHRSSITPEPASAPVGPARIFFPVERFTGKETGRDRPAGVACSTLQQHLFILIVTMPHYQCLLATFFAATDTPNRAHTFRVVTPKRSRPEGSPVPNCQNPKRRSPHNKNRHSTELPKSSSLSKLQKVTTTIQATVTSCIKYPLQLCAPSASGRLPTCMCYALFLRPPQQSRMVASPCHVMVSCLLPAKQLPHSALFRSRPCVHAKYSPRAYVNS